jgi:molybdenum cofactor guanylyltransferase
VKKELIINKLKTLIVVLAGGQSKRFGGGYKTLYKLNNKSLLNRVIKNFEKLDIEIVLNVNSDEKQFKKTGLTLIKDEFADFQGPLAGIYSTMNWALKNKKDVEWIFTAPSDTPFLNSDLVDKFLIGKYSSNTKIILAQNSNKTHPVIGFWHISLFKNLEDFFESDSRKIMHWVEQQNFELLNFENKNYFFNINSKADLIEAMKIEKSLKLL